MSAYQRLLTEYARPDDVGSRRRKQTDDSSNNNETPPPTEDKALHPSERRLRWLKDEAFGNSKYKSTEFNVRRSHISNRKLQMCLEKDVVCYAKFHGTNCDAVERRQNQLYEEQQKRIGIIGSRVLNGRRVQTSMTTTSRSKTSQSTRWLLNVPTNSTNSISIKSNNRKSPQHRPLSSLQMQRLSTAPAEVHIKLRQQQPRHKGQEARQRREQEDIESSRPFTEASDYMVFRHYFDPLEQLGVQRVSSLKPLNSVGKIEIIRTDKLGSQALSKQRQIISSHEVKRSLYRNKEAPEVESIAGSRRQSPFRGSNISSSISSGMSGLNISNTKMKYLNT